MDDKSDFEELLERARAGSGEAYDQILPIVYDELHRMAQARRRENRSFETLNTTALVHEAFLKLAGREAGYWDGRVHFFRIASRAMRDVLVDYARKKRTEKRGGDQDVHPLDDLVDVAEVKADEVVAVHEALHELELMSERQSKIIELRYFVGLTIPETAEVLEISEATVKRDWTIARAWLQRNVERDASW